LQGGGGKTKKEGSLSKGENFEGGGRLWAGNQIELSKLERELFVVFWHRKAKYLGVSVHGKTLMCKVFKKKEHC